MTGRVRSLSSRSGQAPWWPRIAEVPLRGLKSAGAFVSGTRAGVSKRLAHDKWGDLLFPQKRHFLRPENGAEVPLQEQSRYGLA